MQIIDLTKAAQTDRAPAITLIAMTTVRIYGYANDNGFWRTPCNAS